MDLSVKIQHVVVLMFENRSFDHMVGYLKRANSAIDGVDGSEWNPEDPSATPVVKVPISEDADSLDLAVDPGHTAPDVTFQIYSDSIAVLGPLGPNRGFVFNYAEQSENTVSVARKIMRCFSPESLPILTTLAQEFAICDRWHSSVPGPSWPNRMFVHAATSDGHLDNELHDYDVPTIYHHLEDAKLSWRIYFHDFPQTLSLKRLRLDLFKNRFKLFGEFLEDARRGRLPNYSFIEPRYFRFFFKQPNDQHPPHDVALGEVLISDVYEALRNSPLWEQCLLIILWDEHGGIYDHVFPPDHDVMNPEGKVSEDPPFDFQRLGLRVPAVLVSPYIPPNTVDHQLYDHSSVPATLKKIFSLRRFLTNRDAQANTFEANLSLAEPRATPGMLQPSPMAARISARARKLPFLLTERQSAEAQANGELSNRPMSKSQRGLLRLASVLASSRTSRVRSLPAPFDSLATEHEGALYVRKVAASVFRLR